MSEPVADKDRSWAASPCSSCRTSPCCTRLPLHRFHVENRNDLAWAASILTHPRIEVGLYDSGWWMAYYLAPCRFLNPLDSKCLIHGSTRQPQICRDYSPVGCWYKRVFAPAAPAPTAPAPAGVRSAAGPADAAPGASAAARDFIRFDDGRLAALAGMVAFDEKGDLSSVPPWEILYARVTALPLVDTTPAGRPIERLAPPPLDHPARPDSPPETRGGLAFPIRTPRTRRDLDLVCFRLGFHGVRLGINGDEWITLIDDPPEVERYHVLTYEAFGALLESFAFDEGGMILREPRITAARNGSAPAGSSSGVGGAPTREPEPDAST